MAEQYRLERDGDRDLRITAEMLGEGKSGTGGSSGYQGDWTRGRTVRIYRTVGDRYVVQVVDWSRWQGEGERRSVVMADGAAGLLEALSDEDGGLGEAAYKAWWEACAVDEALAALECEEVE